MSFVEISCFFNFFMWVVDVVLLIEDCWVVDLLFVFLDFEFIFFFYIYWINVDLVWKK